MKKNWLIIYDIRDNKRLNKVARTLEGYGIRVQKSVFEMHGTERDVSMMRARIRAIIDREEDYVVYFNLCARDWQKRLKYGVGSRNELDDAPYHIL